MKGGAAQRLTPAQRDALEWLLKGRSLRGLAHGVTINHLKRMRLIEDSDTITDAGRAAIAGVMEPHPCRWFNGKCIDCGRSYGAPRAAGVAGTPAPTTDTMEEARRGYAMRAGAKVYCCYGMYAGVGHDSDCENATPKDGAEVRSTEQLEDGFPRWDDKGRRITDGVKGAEK